MLARKILIVVVMLCLAGNTFAAQPPNNSIPANRAWDVLKPGKKKPDYRKLMTLAGQALGDWKFHFAGLDLDGKSLVQLAERTPDEPFLRQVREQFRLPLDLGDFIFFLDDLLLAGKNGLRGKLVWVTFGRARIAGILVHPHDVFWKNRPRRYGEVTTQLAIDKPKVLAELPPVAKDGDPLGPNWYMRYQSPHSEKSMLAALEKENPDLAKRTASLIKQFRNQGCLVDLHTTLRHRERGYLMWGAYLLSQKKSKKGVLRAVRLLKSTNKKWKLGVSIGWYHPRGWKATVEAARQMKDTYGVGYASKRGALKSKHYDCMAIDLTAMGLPRKLKLTAPGGQERVFDLSANQQTRDLNLTPELVGWVEKHFQLKKVKSDYPHWNDVAKTN
ncbi:MAG: DUF241 domain-containing protein [Deltaproteobacteria bacterium]|nr:DUF241 domain-containing protein [Deltaproteobacteria bacterium]